MGAAASADFYSRLVEIAQKKFNAQNDDDFPPIWIYNLPVTGFDETGFVNPESVKNQLIETAKMLEKAGSDFIVIPCNTAHHFIVEIQSAINIPILSILEATAEVVKKTGLDKVGLLNSLSTKNYRLYETVFEKRNIVVCSTSDEEQLEINKVIGHVIGGRQGKEDVDHLNKIIGRYKSEGAQGVVLGCTELSLAFSQKHTDLPVLDTTELLAEAALRQSFGLE